MGRHTAPGTVIAMTSQALDVFDHPFVSAAWRGIDTRVLQVA